MRSSSTSSRRIVRSSGRGARCEVVTKSITRLARRAPVIVRAAVRLQDDQTHDRNAAQHLAVVSRSARDRRPVHPARDRAARRWPTGCSTRTPPAKRRARDRHRTGRVCRVRQALRRSAEGLRHHGRAAQHAGCGREPARCCATRNRASTSRSCKAARERMRKDATASRRPTMTTKPAGLARQPVLRAGLAVLPHRFRAAPAEGAGADEPVAARRLAAQHRRARQRRRRT